MTTRKPASRACTPIAELGQHRLALPPAGATGPLPPAPVRIEGVRSGRPPGRSVMTGSVLGRWPIGVHPSTCLSEGQDVLGDGLATRRASSAERAALAGHIVRLVDPRR